MRITTHLHQHRGWLLAVVLVTVFSLLVAFVPAQAAPPQVADPVNLEQSQIFNDDLTVRSGQTIDGDVVVYQGDVTVESEGAIRGNLIVYSGEIEIEEGGVVDGDITSFSGDIRIDGVVNGSVSALSGDVQIDSTAVVGGDVSVVSGAIDQDSGASVRGSVLRGPNLKLQLPSVPPIPGVPGIQVAVPTAPQPPSMIEMFLALVWRVIRALLVLALAAGVAVLFWVWRPQLLEETRVVLVERTALSFATGLLFNLFGLAVIGLLWITVCFRPPAVLLGLLFGAINLAGLAVAGNEIGLRAGQRFKEQWVLPWRMILGILLPGAFIAVLWVLGSCFGFFAFIGALALTSFGTGALLVKFLKLGEARGPEAAPLAPMPPAPPSAPVKTTEAPAVVVPAEEAALEPESRPEAPADEPVAAEPMAAEPVVAGLATVDDFTTIAGIGPVFDQRLKDAGVRTFADLAARTPAEIAEIIKWSPERVERAEIIAQAQRLAQGDA